MRWNELWLVLFILLSVAGLRAAEESLYFDNEQLRERYQELTFQLRCPKCQNQNIADSDAPISEDMRDKTYELLHLGYSDEAIVNYMVERYSEFVVYKPRLSLGTVWLWLVPVTGLTVGALVVVLLARRSGKTTSEPISAEERARLDRLLNQDSESS